MKLTKVISTFGWSLIVLGLALSFVQDNTEDIAIETKPIQVLDQSERQCLIESLFHECRNCSRQEQEAVADVIINRVNHPKYPSTICEVIQQDKQFSYRNNLKDKTEIILVEKQDIISILDRKALEAIENIADDRLLSGKLQSKILPSTALFYHTKQVKPKWSKKMKKVQKGIDKGFKHWYFKE